MMIHTNKRSVVFSLNAPIHPANPMINITPPVMINNIAGSSATFVRRPILLSVSFSVHAHNPTAHIAVPMSWKQIQTLHLQVRTMYLLSLHIIHKCHCKWRKRLHLCVCIHNRCKKCCNIMYSCLIDTCTVTPGVGIT